jgi:heptosyltransferase-2
MRSIPAWIRRQGLGIVTQPLANKVDGTEKDYIQTEGLMKLGLRIIRRKLMLRRTGQSSTLRMSADPTWRKGLWIYQRTPQIGDALMDLACRSFFKECNCSVDLLTDANIEVLLQNDPWFNDVTSDVNTLLHRDYDFVVIQSIHHRSLQDKIKYFKVKPWVCMQGFYDVPDFARAQWGAHRLADLWKKTEVADFSFHAKQKLFFDTTANPRDISLTLVLGGKDPSRTYEDWAGVLEGLAKNGALTVTLIGTGEQAESSARDLLQLGLGIKVSNLVNQLKLQQCLQILARTQLLLVADGGAMHMGVAMNVPKIVSLFIETITPELRLPINYQLNAITSPTGNVKDISAHQIAAKVTQLMLSE